MEPLALTGRQRWSLAKLLKNAAVVVAVCIATCWLWALWMRGDPAHQACDCERQIEKTVDPGALQAWCTNLIAMHPPVGTNVHADFYGQVTLPVGLDKAWRYGSPAVMVREEVYGNEPHVDLIWGAGMHVTWGLAVGSPSFEHAQVGRDLRMWKPGIYFWRNFH